MKVYTVFVQKPRWMPGIMAEAALRRIHGIRGWRTEASGNGTERALLLIFATVPHAEKALAKLYLRGWRVGEYVMNADIDQEKRTLFVHDPVGGRDSVDPARLEYGEDGKPIHCWDYLHDRREIEWPKGKAVPEELKMNRKSDDVDGNGGTGHERESVGDEEDGRENDGREAAGILEQRGCADRKADQARGQGADHSAADGRAER